MLRNLRFLAPQKSLIFVGESLCENNKMVPRLYYTGKLKKNVVLDREESRHVKVLRLRIGDMVELFDGKGTVSKGKLIDLEKFAKIEIFSSKKEQKLKPEVELWTAFPKGDRATWLVEKTTEAGVDKIVPIIFKRSVVVPGKKKIERLRRVAIAASAQCQIPFVPEIIMPTEFSKVLGKVDGQLLVCSKDGEKISEIKLEDKIILLVGPEGDFTEEELQALNKKQGLNLSSNILRTETAAVVAVSLVKYRKL